MNRKAIDENKCEIIQGSVSDMPFKDNYFDVASAFETVYFWPDFIKDLKEVKRVLKDNGILFIANEAQPIKDDERQKKFKELLNANIYSKEELSESLQKAGFSNITSFVKQSKDSFTGDNADWICVIAQK